MLIIALVLAVIALAALVTAVVTSNELIAWVCVGASALGVLLLIADAIRDRKRRRLEALAASSATAVIAAADSGAVLDPDDLAADVDAVDDYFDDVIDTDVTEEAEREQAEREQAEREQAEETVEEVSVGNLEKAEDHPEEVVHDEPEYDMYSDDEPEYPESAEESALHTVVIDPSDDEADVTTVDEDDVDLGYRSEGVDLEVPGEDDRP